MHLYNEKVHSFSLSYTIYIYSIILILTLKSKEISQIKSKTRTSFILSVYINLIMGEIIWI